MMRKNPSSRPVPGQASTFAGKVALITGSARGIGKTIAAAFGRSGAKVAICDLNRAASMATVREMRETGIDAYFFSVDLARRGGPQRMVAAVAKKLGRIDVLVNNARAGKRLGLAEDTEGNWDTTVSVGLRAAYFAAQRAIPVMQSRGGGCIVNISSVSALLVSNESAGYHAAKAGLIQLTRFLAANAGSKGVRVNAVLPGFIVQDEHRERYAREDNAAYRARAERSHPLGNVGFASDVAETTLFLCSGSARFITGQAIVVDGGLTIQDPWALVSAAANTADRA